MLRNSFALVTFYAEYPDDDDAADGAADTYSDAIAAAVQALPGVADGSVTVADFDTMLDNREVSATVGWVR